MANVKITELAQETNPASDDVLPIVDVDAASGGGETKKITIADLLENAGDGSAGAPAFAFDNDADTGMYRAGTNTLGFTTGGTGRLFIDSSGNVGIGATTIDELLHLESSNTTVRLKVESTATNSYPGVRFTNDARTYDLQIDGATDAFRIFDGTASTERLRIDTDGRLLMGSSVAGNADADNINVAGAGNVGITLRGSNSGTGNIFFADGTTGDDLKRGQIIYSHSDNSMRLHTNAVERVRVDSSGRLLVQSTSAPTQGVYSQYAPLTVQGYIGSTTGNGILNVARGTTAANLSSGSDIGTVVFSDSAGGEFARISCFADGAPGSNDYPGRISFHTTADGASSPTTAMVINRNGMVGINETNPGHYIDMNIGSNDIGMKMTSTDTGSFIQFADNGTSGETKIGAEGNNFVFDVNGSERGRLDSSGRLLVGTSTALTSPTGSRFQVSGNDFATSSIRQTRYQSDIPGASFILSHARGTEASPTILLNGDELGKIRWNAHDGTDFECVGAEIKAQIDGTILENKTPSKLMFSTTPSDASSPTERMRITSTGQTNYFSSGGNTLVIASSSAASTTNNLIRGVNGSTGIGSGTSAFFVRTNGNVQNATNSYGAISDAKLKENIVDASSQWDDIKNLRVRNYNFIEGQTHTQIGVVAQEVETVSPGLVTESPDTDEGGNDLGTTTKSVNYSVLYMKAVKALQEAMTKIEALEQRLTDAGL